MRSSHSLRGVWVEIDEYKKILDNEAGHSLRGVWVEIMSPVLYTPFMKVTPFGECGLKFDTLKGTEYEIPVTPFGECGLKFLLETMQYKKRMVTPFGECGLKS